MRREKRVVLEEEDDTVVVYTPYSDDFLKDFKCEIEPSQRKWDGERKAWVVDIDYYCEVDELVNYHFGHLEIEVK